MQGFNPSGKAHSLFSDLKIAKDPRYKEFLNKYECSVYPLVEKDNSLPIMIAKISESTERKFIIIIDEWDALFREAKDIPIYRKNTFNYSEDYLKAV